MLNSKEINNYITKLMANEDEDFVIGNGVLTSMKIAFSKMKLEENKEMLANILHDLGVDNYPLITLDSLTTLKDGQVWNKLESMEDFAALDILLACSHACSFIDNDLDTVGNNINNLGEIDSLYLTLSGRKMVNDDTKWLAKVKELSKKMNYLTFPAEIKANLQKKDNKIKGLSRN